MLLLLFRLQVISWIRGDGEDTLNKFTEVPLECEAVIKDHEQEFEKFYFISMVSSVWLKVIYFCLFSVCPASMKFNFPSTETFS